MSETSHDIVQAGLNVAGRLTSDDIGTYLAFHKATITVQLEQMGLDPTDPRTLAGAVAGALILLNFAEKFTLRSLTDEQVAALRNPSVEPVTRPDLRPLADYTVALGELQQSATQAAE
jgi:hypothetical protein